MDIIYIVFVYSILFRYSVGTSIEYSNIDDNIHLESSILKRCKLLNGNNSIFECLLDKFDRPLDKYGWFLTLPSLYPNTILYNEKVIEIDQVEEFTKNGYIKEPKFGSMFYRLPFNEYYNTIDVKHKETYHILSNTLSIPLIVIDANFGHTSSVNDKVVKYIHGESMDIDMKFKLILIHLNYKIFTPYNCKLNLYKFLYKKVNKWLFYRKFAHLVKCSIRALKNHYRILENSHLLRKMYNMTNNININLNNQLPFVSIPNSTITPLEYINNNESFITLLSTIRSYLLKNKSHMILNLLKDYFYHLLLNNQTVSLKLDVFYVLEIIPRSYGYSFLNMLLPKDRLLLWNHIPKCIVYSHVYKFDADLPLARIIKIHLISTFCSIITFVLLLIFIIKY